MTPEEFTAKRLCMGYTRDSLAEALGMTGKWRRTTIGDWETGKEPISQQATATLTAMWEAWIDSLGAVVDQVDAQAETSGDPEAIDLQGGGSALEQARMRALLILLEASGYTTKIVRREA